MGTVYSLGFSCQGKMLQGAEGGMGGIREKRGFVHGRYTLIYIQDCSFPNGKIEGVSGPRKMS